MQLKQLRVAKGVTQKDVAKAIGCSNMTYSRYENEQRQPDIQTLKDLATYFGTSIDAIIGYQCRQSGICVV